MDRYNVDWTEIFQECDRIAEQIRAMGNQIKYIYGVPRGGITPAAIIAKMIHRTLLDDLVDMGGEATNVVAIIDDIKDTGETRKRFRQFPHFFPLFESRKTEWLVFPWERAQNEAPAEDAVIRILQAIGEDPEREGLKDTPKRVVKSWNRLYGGYFIRPKDILSTVFSESGDYDEIVALKGIEFYSNCEHHMLPFYGSIHIGYLPDGKVVGISKLARLVECFSRRLQIQERLTTQISNALNDVLKPKGVGVVVKAQHLCMVARGVEKQHSWMVTSSMTGVFRDDPQVRNEFLKLVGE